jgi:hypothetical protein
MNTIVYPYPIKIVSLALPKISQKFLLALGLSLMVAMVCLFLWQNIQIVSQTYLVQSYQQKLGELKKENTNLQLNVFQGNSLGALEKQVQGLGMEKTDKVDFIHALGSSVVIRK